MKSPWRTVYRISLPRYLEDDTLQVLSEMSRWTKLLVLGASEFLLCTCTESISKLLRTSHEPIGALWRNFMQLAIRPTTSQKLNYNWRSLYCNRQLSSSRGLLKTDSLPFSTTCTAHIHTQRNSSQKSTSNGTINSTTDGEYRQTYQSHKILSACWCQKLARKTIIVNLL